MNLYIRYFSHEMLATNMSEASDFLTSISEININITDLNRVQAFWESNNSYPFRLKVSFSNYVLFLKTEAKDLPEFKYLEQQNKAVAKQGGGSGNNTARKSSANMDGAESSPAMQEKKRMMEILNTPQEGWYEATMMFKRVVQMPSTNKCQYRDTRFRVRLKATSGLDCYNRIIEHMRNRQDVDQRSQFPSAKSSNFHYTFLGNESDFVNPDNVVSDSVDSQS